MNNTSIYNTITDKIIEKLEKGVIPWKATWKGVGLPINAITKKPYRGINAFMLFSEEFNSPFWLTYNQAKSLGASVKPGEKGTKVIFWKWLEKENPESKETTKIPLLKQYSVFNALQCEGLELDPITEKPTGINECEKVVTDFLKKETGLILSHAKNMPFYQPENDLVNIPAIQSFKTKEAYYNTLFHEFIHATGHKSRLNRELTAFNSSGAESYSKEELIAELGASFLSCQTGIESKTLDDSASYISGWIKALKNDKKMLIHAGAKAQQATDFILGTHLEASE